MYSMMIVLGVCCLILLFLYIQLKKDIKSLHDQLHYTKEERSDFMLFSSSSNKEIKEVIKDINGIRQEMQDAKSLHIRNEKDVRDMIANISHDIRTPLTSIQGYVEMIQQSEDVIERERFYRVVMNRLQDLESMLDEFFLYTKLMNTSELYTLEKKEIYPLLCQTLLNYMDVLNEHNLTPEVCCDDEGITACIHEESFQRICMNLIINTVRYGMNPFHIIIKKVDHQICIEFKNACITNEQMDVEHMFDRFYKGNQARSQKGCGLGLAIVKELCERMNAVVSAQYSDQTLCIQVLLPYK